MALSLNFKSSKIITILVGPSKASYTFHKDLLCAHSPFFEKCLSSSFVEGRKERVELPEDSPEVFENFIDWTYREDIVEPTDQPSLQLAIHTYAFADKLRMPAFKNCVMTKIRAYHERASIHLDSLLLWRALELPENLPLGQFLFDQVGFDMLRHPRKYFLRSDGNAKRGDVDSFAEDQGSLVSDVLWAVLQAANQKYDDPAMRKGCHYHEHADDDVECPDTAVLKSKKKEKKPLTATNTSREDVASLLKVLGMV